MSSATAFTSHVLIVVAFLVWALYQKTEEAHRTKTALLGSWSGGCQALWRGLLSIHQTPGPTSQPGQRPAQAICYLQKSSSPILQESDIQTNWGKVLLKPFWSSYSLHLLRRPCDRYIKGKEHHHCLQHCSKKVHIGRLSSCSGIRGIVIPFLIIHYCPFARKSLF